MDYRNLVIENLVYSLALNDMGIYPKSVSGGPTPYEKRTERMEGYNEAVMEITNKSCRIEEFLNKCNNRELEDALMKEEISISVREDGIKLMVNCNDVFHWACADCEEITIEEIPELAEAIALTEKYGSMLWVCRKRKMRPQRPWYKDFFDHEKILFDACGPERDPKDEG